MLGGNISGKRKTKGGGAEGDNLSLNIKSCSKGVVNGNSIEELNIEQGRNEFDVVFFDNMKHAVKIEAYENI